MPVCRWAEQGCFWVFEPTALLGALSRRGSMLIERPGLIYFSLPLLPSAWTPLGWPDGPSGLGVCSQPGRDFGPGQAQTTEQGHGLGDVSTSVLTVAVDLAYRFSRFHSPTLSLFSSIFRIAFRAVFFQRKFVSRSSAFCNAGMASGSASSPSASIAAVRAPK